MSKVSIIVPVYNTEKYLPECLESILKQTLADFELIIVDDGSSDGSGALVKEFARKDNRIKTFFRQNQGVAAARNFGLTHAEGEYVYFCDSDDTISPDFLETSYDCAVQNNSDLVVLGNHDISTFCTQTSAMFIRRRFFDDHPDVRFPSGIQPCEDGILSNELLALTEKISFNPKAFYFYRKHPEQNSRKINKNCEKICFQIEKWLSILDNFYKSHALLPSKAFQYAQFIRHEPFSLRFYSMPFNLRQRKFIANLIARKMTELKPYLTQDECEQFSFAFRFTYTSPNIAAALLNRHSKRLIRIFISLVPIKAWRKFLRKNLLR